MTPSAFDRLLSMVSPWLKKYSRRESICPGERLAITLRYLASGNSHVSLMYLFRVSAQCIGKIVLETSTVLYRELKGLVFPKLTTDLWLRVASEFETMWNIPHCLGAVGGKHVAVQAFPHCASRYFNYKGFHSMILMAVADAKLKFISVDFGGSGRRGGANVFNHSALGRKMAQNEISAPPPSDVNGINLPYVFVGDAAFQGIRGILTPFPGKFLPPEENLFNYRLSRARRIIENAFGVLCARFRILRTSIIASPTLVKSIVMCCLALHNFHLMDEESIPPRRRKYKGYGYEDYVREDGTYIFGRWRQESKEKEFKIFENLKRKVSNKDPSARTQFSSDEVMENFLQYFMENPVSWQWTRI
ncbi:Protein ANTAGONIST OF LIKE HETEROCHROMATIN PROTEIN 1 [Frankliniella fusca]|uniref:Protein ANTAGONIST OF LIKE HETEROCHROMATIN PROTEIN 1 n=1 Tax=Frankliniella fusca TaxID=407009 RepID=A0AAE1LTA6_9NEOP|nr:Protein ANTAGONIST OF LIKE HETEROCHROMATIN PROTEIN 1 [Frankliniella fusca]